ncbi:MAG: hypothetical protein QNJ44_22845 [Rhodobacter sp.]|nr:hypothetical protein [Rhodobacter sp.]
MLDQVDTKQKEHDAVLALAQNLSQYGQFESVLSLLDLANWLAPGSQQVNELRVATFMKLGRWEDALTEVLEHVGIDSVDRKTLALLYWNLGETGLGDQSFRQSVTMHRP